MSEQFLDNPIGLLGLLAGILIALIIYFINRRIALKRRTFDERYYALTNRSKARAWDAMLIILLIAWAIVIIFDGISFSFWLMTFLYVSHNVSLIVTTLYVSNKESK